MTQVTYTPYEVEVLKAKGKFRLLFFRPDMDRVAALNTVAEEYATLAVRLRNLTEVALALSEVKK